MTLFDRTLEVFCLVVILISYVIPLYFYSELPEQIPSHYNASGQPDNYSAKYTLFILPSIGCFLYLFLTFIATSTYWFNQRFGGQLPSEEQIKSSSQLVRIVKLIALLSFLYINWNTIQIGLGYSESLGNYFLLIFLVAIFSPIAYYLVKNKKLKQNI